MEDLLSLTTYEILPNFFAFFEAKSGGLETHDYPIFFPNFMPFLEPKVEDFLAPTRHEMLPQCSAFLEPKLGGLFVIKYISEMNSNMKLSILIFIYGFL